MRERRQGFTIVEVLLVVAVMVVLAGAAGGVYWGSYQRSQLDGAGRELLLTAKYARVNAIENQRCCKLKFDQVNHGYWLAYDEIDDRTNRSDERVIRDSFSKPTRLGEGIEFLDVEVRAERWANGEGGKDRDVSEVVFAPDGTADAAVVVVGNRETFYTLMISRPTGKARLHLGEPDRTMEDSVDLDL